MRQIPAAVCQCVIGNKNDCLHQIYLKEEVLYKKQSGCGNLYQETVVGIKKIYKLIQELCYFLFLELCYTVAGIFSNKHI